MELRRILPLNRLLRTEKKVVPQKLRLEALASGTRISSKHTAFDSDSHFLVALDECAVQGSSICKNGKCTDLKEGFMCTCNPGYSRQSKTVCVGKSMFLL